MSTQAVSQQQHQQQHHRQQHQLQTIIYASTAMTEELKKQPQKQQQGDNVYPTDNINNSHDATTVAHHQNHSTTVKEIY